MQQIRGSDSPACDPSRKKPGRLASLPASAPSYALRSELWLIKHWLSSEEPCRISSSRLVRSGERQEMPTSKGIIVHHHYNSCQGVGSW